MGMHTDTLITRRANLRLFGWLLSLAGILSFLYVLFTTLNTATQARRQGPFEEVQDAYLLFLLPLTDGGKIISLNFIGALLGFAALTVGGVIVLKAAHDITLELKATEAEVNRRLRVEEGLRERRGSHA